MFDNGNGLTFLQHPCDRLFAVNFQIQSHWTDNRGFAAGAIPIQVGQRTIAPTAPSHSPRAFPATSEPSTTASFARAPIASTIACAPVMV